MTLSRSVPIGIIRINRSTPFRESKQYVNEDVFLRTEIIRTRSRWMGMKKTVVIVRVVVGLVNWIPLRLSHEELNTREKRKRQGGSLNRTPETQTCKVIININAHGYICICVHTDVTHLLKEVVQLSHTWATQLSHKGVTGSRCYMERSHNCMRRSEVDGPEGGK